jgi:hypothetical protein
MEEITKLIDDLQPQAARYDTPIADDLVICTFPNGVRTWIFAYTTNGYQRRQSLGVYPEMSLADARQALFAARKLQAVEDQLAEHGLGSETVRQLPDDGAATVPNAQGRPRWLERRTISAALAGGLMSIAILLGSRHFPFDYYFERFAPVKPRATSPMGPPVVARNAERARTAAAGTAAARPGTPTAPATSATAAPVAATAAGDASPDAIPAEGGTAAAETVAQTAPVTSVAELSAANRALLKAQESLRGSVAREVLARGIEEGRPVGPFQTQVALDMEAPTTLYYFTELRGMAGRTVLHRWLHEGRLFSETSMQVGEGWLSALHSSATIAPGMTGRWEVRICDASGRALEQESFELAAATQLSSR